MSVNPLFTGPVPTKRPQQRGAGYVLRQTNLNAGNLNYRSSPGPRKKPRMSDPRESDMTNESDPFQDFDSFTEDDLETFDMIASQALSQQPPPLDHGPPGQALKRPTSAPRFLNHPSSASSVAPVSSAQVTDQSSTATNTQASSGYGSHQHSSNLGVSGVGRFTFKAADARGGQAQAPATSAMAQRMPTPTSAPAQSKTHTRQSNVSGTKIYYSSQYRTGSTSPGSHQQVENLDSMRAQSLQPNRSTGMLRNTIQSNTGPKVTSVKSEPYSGSSVRMGVNPNMDGPLGLRVDVNAKNTPLPYSAKTGPHPPRANAGETFHSGPSQSGGRSTASLTPPKGAIARESPGLPTTEKDSGSASQTQLNLQQQQVFKYRTECETAKHQLKRLTEELCTKDGEIQVLRQNLSKVKAESSLLQTERAQADWLKKQQMNEVERDLKKEIESLKTQLQFQEAELMQAYSASQNQRTRPPVACPSTGAPVTPPRHPLPPASTASRANNEDTRDSCVFPTQQTFMADNPKVDRGQLRSPRVKTFSEGQPLRSSPRRSPKTGTMSKSPGKASPAPLNSTSSLNASSSVQHSKPPTNCSKSCLISARLQQGPSRDAQLVGSLLQDRDWRMGPSVAGLMGLVQTSGWERLSIDVTEAGVSGQPSPTKPKRVFLSERSSHEQSIELVTRAISNILNPPRIPPLPPNAILPLASTHHHSPGHPHVGLSPAEDISDSVSYITDLLPLLEDQLTVYIDTTHSITQSNAPALCSTCPSSSSTGSRSLECSLDSSGSSSPSEESLTLGRAEAAVLTSLALLRHLMTCSSAVRTAVLQGSALKDCEPSGSDADVSAMEIDPSAPLIDPTQGLSKPSGRSSALRGAPLPDTAACPGQQRTNRILSKLMRIASMQHGLGNLSAVVESALASLLVLIEKSNNKEKDRLQSLLVHDALYVSLSRDSSFTQASHALDILTALASSGKLTCKYCNQSDSCLLLQCYRVGVRGLVGCNAPHKIQLTVKTIAVLWRIIGTHHQGAAMLLDTDCQCSMELINAAVLMVRKVLQVIVAMTTHKHPTKYWRYVLHQGLLLLHCLATADRHFTDHRLDVDKVYVATVTALSKLYHTMADMTDNEGGLVQDLWDFIQCDEPEWEAEDDDEDQQLGGVKMELDQ